MRGLAIGRGGGVCPTGNVVQTASSPHGNYVVFTCSNGGAYLGYVGGQ